MTEMPTVLVVCPMGDAHENFRNSVFSLNHAPILYLFGKTGESYTPADNATETNQRRWKVIANARNQILLTAMKMDWDYILWLDSDIEVYPDLIEDLLKFTPKEKVISAEYIYRYPEKPKWIRTKASPLPILNFNLIDIFSGGPDDVRNPPYKMWYGLGCLLVAREVHEKVGAFVGDTGGFVGEDVYYCKLIRDAGFHLFLAPIRLNHFPKRPPDYGDDSVIPSNYRDPNNAPKLVQIPETFRESNCTELGVIKPSATTKAIEDEKEVWG